jgi:hypothetical protein
VHRAVAIAILAGCAMLGRSAHWEHLHLLGLHLDTVPESLIFLLGAAALVTLVAVVAGDLLAHGRAGEAQRLSGLLVRTNEPAAIASTRDPNFLDLGVGDPRGAGDPSYHHIVENVGYRGTPSSRLWLTGDPAAALAITRRAILVDLGALSCAFGALLWSIA